MSLADQMRPLAKRFGTVAASAIGRIIVGRQRLERPCAAVVGWLWETRALHPVARVCVQEWARRLEATRQPWRPLDVAALHRGEARRLVLDVTGMGLREAYFARRTFEPETVRWLQSHLTTGHVFVDVGANVGYYTVMGSALVGTSGTVVAFEPNPVVRAKLEQHLELNETAANVRVFGVALSDAPHETAEFLVPADPTQSLFGSLVEAWALTQVPTERITVRTETFDGWLAIHDLGRIDVMKIDVEGGEELVLRGMSRTLETVPPRYIVCETQWDGPAHQLLSSHGYQGAPLEWMAADSGYGNILYTRG